MPLVGIAAKVIFLVLPLAYDETLTCNETLLYAYVEDFNLGRKVVGMV